MPKTTFVERVLIVLNPDGTLKGAHQESLTLITENGEVLMERQEAAQPLDSATLLTVLPDQAALLAENIQQEQAIIAMQKIADETGKQLAELGEKLAAAEERAKQLDTALAVMTAERDAALESVAAIQSKLESELARRR